MLLQHSGKAARPSANLKCARGLVPGDWDGGVLPFFVVVGVALVLIESEMPVRSTVDAQFNWVGRLLIGILKKWSHRKDRAWAYEQRQSLNRSRGLNRLSSLCRLASPEVVPGRAGGRQVD